MFKSLRNKFVALIMLIFSTVMIAAFIAIYLTTYNNIKAENKQKLSRSNIIYSTPLSPIVASVYGFSEDTRGNLGEGIQVSVAGFAPNDTLSFTVIVDSEGNIRGANSIFDMPDEAYQKAAEIAWHQKKDYSVINVESKEWIYGITEVVEMRRAIEITEGNPFTKSFINSAGDINVIVEKHYAITFLDVTESNNTLKLLLYTFLIAGAIMLFVIMTISFYFANRAIKPISETWEKQQQFIADASHELKTPVTIIKSNVGVLLDNREDTIGNQLEWFDYINVGVERMTKLVNQLLELLKINDSDLNIQSETFNMSNVVKNTVQSMEAAAVEKSISLSVKTEPDIIIQSYEEKITQVLTILLDNAIKYADIGGWIEVSLSKSKRHIVCSVRNSGKGISKENINKIFDRFYRTDFSRNSESGSYGLGLSIAKAIVDKLGGKIYAESIENEYTTFTVVI